MSRVRKSTEPVTISKTKYSLLAFSEGTYCKHCQTVRMVEAIRCCEQYILDWKDVDIADCQGLLYIFADTGLMRGKAKADRGS